MLDARETTLRVKEAREELNKTLADPKATELERERAKLSLDEALRNADKQKAKNRELTQSVADARKAGVDGNKQVQHAVERVAEANGRLPTSPAPSPTRRPRYATHRFRAHRRLPPRSGAYRRVR